MKEIETIHITPTKEMPLEVFRECYRFSSFAELMQRTEDGKVIWDEGVVTIWSDDAADVVYHMVQKGMIEVTLEVPKEHFQ
jgi:hypothetical protein